jgi:ribokinase
MRDRIVVVGSLNQDLVVNLHRAPDAGETVHGESIRAFFGGKGANQAYAAARLGGRAVMVGQVGADAAGDAQVESLRSAGVDVGLVRRASGEATGTAVIAVDAAGQNRIVVIPGANGTFWPGLLDAGRADVAGAAAVLVQLEVPPETVARAVGLAREGGARVILDPAPARPLPDAVLSSVDYLTPNLTELSRLAGGALPEDAAEADVVRCARTLCARGVRTVIAKLGPRGAVLVSADAWRAVPGFRVAAVDTTAAGDCFNGAFATALVSGAPEVEACRFAAAAAAVSVTRRGAQASMPTRDEVMGLLGCPGALRGASGRP